MGDGSGFESSIDRDLEKCWSVLSFLDRAVILHDIGIKENNEFHMGGKTIEEVLRLDQDDLPSEIRGRLIMAMTSEGFTKEEYERVRGVELFKKGPERGN